MIIFASLSGIMFVLSFMLYIFGYFSGDINHANNLYDRAHDMVSGAVFFGIIAALINCSV